MFDVGIIGGMGPAATAELFRRVVLYTKASVDQEHVKMCIFNDVTIPDRTTYILKGGASPLTPILDDIEIAKQVGCSYYAIPCNTSHYFHCDFENVSGIKFINMVRETFLYASYTYPNRRIYVLATLGTIAGDVYGSNTSGNCEIYYLSEASNCLVMEMISRIKAGERNLEAMSSAMMEVLTMECNFDNSVFLLACTELSLLKPYLQGAFVDSLDVLAGCIVSKTDKKLNLETFDLNPAYFLEK